jgi:hypothetical protein
LKPLYFSSFRSPSPQLSADELRAVVNAFFVCPPALREELRIAIDRLNLAAGNLDVVDIAIDLGISLEALLLHQMGRDRGELSYRLRLRGAALLGGTVADRKATYDVLNRMYGYRSAAAHTGRLDADVKYANFDPGIALGARLIRKVIEHGAWPDWDARVLGG